MTPGSRRLSVSANGLAGLLVLAAVASSYATYVRLRLTRPEAPDYAQATSQLSKAQILQQASTAMVSQANTIPQNILTLLQKLP